MFEPNFQYTHKIVNNLKQIAVARELILNSPLIPKWEVTLRREAIIHSAHSSTSIEGNRLSLEQVSDLAQGREVIATRKDKQEVLNYLKVLEDIDKLIHGKKITEQDILNIHKMVTQETLENPNDCGVYRNHYLEYFVEGVRVSISAVKERVVRLSSERLRRTKKGQVALTERQMRIVEFINQNGRITNRSVREMLKISDRAALKEIRKLVDLKVIEPEGKGRSLGYVLA